MLTRSASSCNKVQAYTFCRHSCRTLSPPSAALEMGLSPDQLLLLEEFAEELKGGRVAEERLVATLQRRVRRPRALYLPCWLPWHPHW